ncbi:MAG: transposase [Sandaracinus sp.]
MRALHEAAPALDRSLCRRETDADPQRRYPTKVGPRGVVRREYEYRRGGTCQLLGAYEVGTGRVHGRIVEHRDAKALIAFLDEVVRKYPRRTIYIVWDNLNLHLDGRDARWTRFARRHRGRVHFVHTPLHASWVNQIEIWFSILQRRDPLRQLRGSRGAPCKGGRDGLPSATGTRSSRTRSGGRSLGASRRLRA